MTGSTLQAPQSFHPHYGFNDNYKYPVWLKQEVWRAMRAKERAAYLLGVFKAIGEELDTRAIKDEEEFEKRLRIQKIVYLLQGHPEFRRYLDFYFSMYFHGPYSTELAFVYYNELDRVTPAEVSLSKKALDYAAEITDMSTDDLELLATLAETIRVNRGRVEDEEIIRIVHQLKPLFPLEKIAELLKRLKYLKEKYGLRW